MVKAFLFSAIQGLSEFLPISSSGHLYIIKKILKLPSDLLPFFIYLHVATLFSLIVFFYRDIILSFKNKKILLNIGVATSITFISVLFFRGILGRYFSHKYLISLGFLITAFLLLAIRDDGNKKIEDLKIKDCAIIGILQALAVIPGISRSGITITGLMKRGLKKIEAFKFSFLLAIPTIFGAFLLKIKDLSVSGLSADYLAESFFIAFVLGLLALRILRRYVYTNRLYQFGYYCILVGVVGFLL